MSSINGFNRIKKEVLSPYHDRGPEYLTVNVFEVNLSGGSFIARCINLGNQTIEFHRLRKLNTGIFGIGFMADQDKLTLIDKYPVNPGETIDYPFQANNIAEQYFSPFISGSASGTIDGAPGIANAGLINPSCLEMTWNGSIGQVNLNCAIELMIP